MGNRAIIKAEGSNIGVYLHWNGGIDSVTAFLKYCELKGYPAFGGGNADGYGIARFCQVVGNFFGGTNSIGIVHNILNSDAESLDNGIYIVDGWEIKSRINGNSRHEGYDLIETLCKIDAAQPKNERLTKGYITAKEVDPKELKIKDRVYIRDFTGEIKKFTVVGFGPEGKWVCGHDVSGLPYINKYADDDGVTFANNINNYIREPVRVASK